MTSTPYRVPWDAPPPEPARAPRSVVLLRAASVATTLMLAASLGALAHAALARPAPPIQLGPAAIAKLRRPLPSLLGYGAETHDPWRLRSQALDLVEHGYDLRFVDVRLSDREARRLRGGGDDLSGLEPVLDRGELAAVRVGRGTPLSRAIGLREGDVIRAIDGLPAPLIDDKLLRSPASAAVLEVERAGAPVVFFVAWR